MNAFSHLTLGVTAMDTAMELWSGTFQMETVARQTGDDPALNQLWSLPAGSISDQALLRTGGDQAGGLHLVQFARPAAAVRDGARATDLLPKNLDIYTSDLPGIYARLQAAGQKFRSAWAETTDTNGLTFREVHMPAHDHINVVLLEIMGEPMAFSPGGFAGVGALVSTVPDVRREKQFYQQCLGLEPLLSNLLSGPHIEAVIGLPPGAGLAIEILGDTDSWMGRMELVEYQRAESESRYERARPPALGTLHPTWQVAHLDPLRARLRAAGQSWTEHGHINALFGTGEMLSTTSPAGLHIAVQATA